MDFLNEIKLIKSGLRFLHLEIIIYCSFSVVFSFLSLFFLLAAACAKIILQMRAEFIVCINERYLLFTAEQKILRTRF